MCNDIFVRNFVTKKFENYKKNLGGLYNQNYRKLNLKFTKNTLFKKPKTFLQGRFSRDFCASFQMNPIWGRPAKKEARN